ncbi:TPA: hypothetical protein TU173_001888 [Streptococcus equi subsp. zooepidemicus]|nr:hypothetical protein [Streptococcus equi subsp. zooepidemicus]
MYESTFYAGNLNIYGKETLSPIFLICSLFEAAALINRNEKIFIPLRVVNTILILRILFIISGKVRDSVESASFVNEVGNSISSFTSFLTGGLFNMPENLATESRLLIGYYIILFALLLSIIAFVSYLYYRFFKNEKLVQESKLHFYDFVNVFTENRLFSFAICLVIISQFLPFNKMSTLMEPASAFGDHPFISSIICIIAFLILVSLSQKNIHNIKYYILVEIGSLVIWNPFYVFQYGNPGVGYIIYIVGLALLVYSLVGNKLLKNS